LNSYAVEQLRFVNTEANAAGARAMPRVVEGRKTTWNL
jgi:hypothetical protein